MPENPFKILGLARDFDDGMNDAQRDKFLDDLIRAQQFCWHTGRDPDNKKAEARFLKIQQAKAMLDDPEQRAALLKACKSNTRTKAIEEEKQRADAALEIARQAVNALVEYFECFTLSGRGADAPLSIFNVEGFRLLVDDILEEEHQALSRQHSGHWSYTPAVTIEVHVTSEGILVTPMQRIETKRAEVDSTGLPLGWWWASQGKRDIAWKYVPSDSRPKLYPGAAIVGTLKGDVLRNHADRPAKELKKLPVNERAKRIEQGYEWNEIQQWLDSFSPCLRSGDLLLMFHQGRYHILGRLFATSLT